MLDLFHLNFVFENIDRLLEITLAFITMSLGLNLTRKDFDKLFLNPKTLTIGLIAQMVLLPILAFAIMSFTNFSPAIKVGFIIISLCPGGVTSNLVSYMLKGNIALSISLTVINGLLCMISIPFLTNLALNTYFGSSEEISLPVFKTLYMIALVTVLPAFLGVLIRSHFTNLAKKLVPVLKYLMPILLFTVFLVKIFAPTEKGGIALSTSELFDMGIWALLLNFSSMFFGFLFANIFSVKLTNKITIMVEVGLQNTALALFICGTLLKNIEMQKPAMVYVIFTFVSTFLFAWLIKTVSIKFRKDEMD